MMSQKKGKNLETKKQEKHNKKKRT